MGEANKRGSFEKRQKLAIERNAREAEEAARLERLRPRGSSRANSVLALTLAVASIGLNPPRKRAPETFTLDDLK
jgi:hypothetical protein